METLRFLQITTHFPPASIGGDARFVEYLSNELASRGHEVHVLHNPSVYEALRKRKNEDAKADKDSIVKIHSHLETSPTTSLLWALNFRQTMSARNAYEDLVKELKPDVIHWHNTKGFFGEPLHGRGSRALYTAHDYYALCPRSSFLRPGHRVCRCPLLCQTCLLGSLRSPQLWRAAAGRRIKVPDDVSVIAPSEFMANMLKNDGIAVKGILRNFVPDIGSRPADREPGNDLLYLGVLERYKGPLTLLEAFAKSSDHHGFRLWLVGEGTLRNDLKERVQQLKLTDRVFVPGYLAFSELESLRRKAASLIVPSEWFENAPLTVLEAFASSIPVIGSRVGGIPEILDEGSGSTLFAPGDVAELSATLGSLWDNRESLKELGRKARGAYERGFTPSAHLKNYLRMISEH